MKSGSLLGAVLVFKLSNQGLLVLLIYNVERENLNLKPLHKSRLLSIATGSLIRHVIRRVVHKRAPKSRNDC